ncbi:MAG: sel1 repeat family protein [Alphaproteobacteria bacterium]|nr:sel1 repeat family protein [Alphaproteobacteria bacterium]
MKNLICALVAAVILAGTPAVAQDYNAGVAAFQDGDYAGALNIWTPLAENEDADAQRNIGAMYQRGLGVPQSDAEAVKWYRRAAENGHPRAQQNLGVMYEEGAGVPQDYVEAAAWYRAAAAQGNLFAKLNLGVLYERGSPDVPRDVVQSHMWYNLAAAQGHADAGQLRDDIAAAMTPEQVAEAQRQAQAWLVKNQKP